MCFNGENQHPIGFNDFRQGFIALEQGLEGFCNPYLATKTMNSVRTIRRL